jgi:Secretion system C-terminal sorting domain
MAQTNTYHSFPETDAMWKTHYEYTNHSGPCNDGVVHFERSYIQSGDTTLNGMPYNKLFLSAQTWSLSSQIGSCAFNTYPGTTTIGAFIGGLRNDSTNKSVYYYDAEQKQECLLYDFNLTVSDTIKNCKTISSMGAPPYGVITSIDSILVGTKYHKKFNYKGTSVSTKYSIVEGMGGLTGLLEPRVFFENDGTLECFSIASQPLYYISSSACGIVGIKEAISLGGFEIHPNPSKGAFTIESLEKISAIEVLNMLGEKIFFTSANYKQETVNLSSQQNGIYFLQLKTEQGTVSKKIIIQH